MELLDRLYAGLVGRYLYPFYEGTVQRRNTFRYRAEMERSQWRSPEEVQARQWEQLRALLDHAHRTVEYYRSEWDRLGIRPGEISSPSDFARLPVIDKPLIREHRDRLLSTAFRREELVRSATGGSTGSPLQFFYNRDSYQRRLAAAMRGDSWAGWQFCAPEFYIWGVTLMPQSRISRLRSRLYHGAIRRSVLNCFDLSAERIEAVVRQFNRFRPRVVVGYSNAVYEFARFVQRAGLSLHRPEGVICSAEKLYPHQRALIEEVLGTRVFERYGCREVMMIGAECDRHEGLHVASDNVYVEVVRNGRLCEPGEAGEILLTDLHNYGMPLIRYKVGDLGSWKGRDCSCGRGLPLLNPLEGRSVDVITTPGGRIVSGLFFPHLFKDFPAIQTYQVVQETREEVTVRLVLERPMEGEETRLLQEIVGSTLGPEIRITWEAGPDVQIERASKFRPVLSRIPAGDGAETRP
jgi:phenylacetate-CoA ligase